MNYFYFHGKRVSQKSKTASLKAITAKKDHYYVYTIMPYTNCILVRNIHFWSYTKTYTVCSIDSIIYIPSVYQKSFITKHKPV